MDWRERRRIKSRYETTCGIIIGFILSSIGYFLGLQLLDSETCVGMLIMVEVFIGIQIGETVGSYLFERKYGG